MKLDGIGADRGFLPLDLLALGLKSREPILQRARQRAADDRIDKPANLSVDRRETLLDRSNLHRRLAVEFAHYAVIFGDVFGDEFRVGEMFLDPCEHAILDG
ncbi:hypothetical protein [Bradyrhizobium diazoefficiens]|uniref:hypothetical protein n=1 Tax=Bradyrhizobium diazoefficiens TaxID=1355477 RepID=UPI001FD14711|nr:hypothetical protein [Bradyrhizobium diazoefficiens]WLC15667.1 hypothetical protein QIH76_37030 [Bradyrhizobium diazoefficiens]